MTAAGASAPDPPMRPENGRGGEIRTRDLYVPNVALYQAKLRPDIDLRVVLVLPNLVLRPRLV